LRVRIGFIRIERADGAGSIARDNEALLYKWTARDNGRINKKFVKLEAGTEEEL